MSVSKEQNMFVAERFLLDVVEEYGEHPVSTDGSTWYLQACRFLKLDHHIHSSYEKRVSLKEQRITSKTEPNALTITSNAERRNVN